MVENVGVAVGIASSSHFVQKLFPLPVFTSRFVADMWSSGRRPMSGPVGSAIPRSGMVENVRAVSFVVVRQA